MKRLLILFLFLSFVVALIGCTTQKQPITQETLNYFEDLQNKTFWIQKSSALELNEIKQGKVVLVEGGNYPKGWHIAFLKVNILSENKEGEPTKAVITTAVFATENDSGKNYQFLVEADNEKQLENFLTNTITDEHRRDVLYNAAMESAKNFITNGKWDDAIAEINKAHNYKDTTEAESLLDSVYYYKGRSLYKIGEYERAKQVLSLVKHNESWIKQAKGLMGAIDAKKKEKLEKAKRVLRVTKDEFKETTFYNHYLDPKKNPTKGKIYLFPYIGVNQVHKWYFLRLHMYLDDWLFAEKVYAIVGNKHYETPAYDSLNKNVTHDVWYNGIHENIDFDGDNSQVNSLVRAVVNAPLGTKIKFRIEGIDHYRDITMTREEQQAWKDVMYFYDNGISKP